MVTGRADVAEGILDLPGHHQIHAQHHRARSAQRSLIAERIHRGVAVEMHDPLLRSRGFDRVDIGCIVHAQQLFAGRLGRVMVLQIVQQPRCDQLILDRMDARRRFRMMRAHVVLEAQRMADIGSLHGGSCNATVL